MKTEYITLDLDSAPSNASLTRLASTGGFGLPTEWGWGEDPCTQAPQRSVLICGVDEVGRGALFGPVVAAAVILPPSVPELVTDRVRDSKQLSGYRRNKLAEKIWTLAIDCKIGFASTAEIDHINILQASLLAMKRAVLKLKVQPELCLVDGNQPIKNLPMLQQTLVKGDERSLVIASASIIAKVWRDALVVRLASKYPMYDLVANKGYGTERHLQALQQYGPSRLHRMSFRPCQPGG